MPMCALVARGNEMEWKPIETAPKDGTPILACDEGSYPYIVEWFEYGSGVWIGADKMYWSPDYWMPLPSPPSKANISPCVQE